jgi:hypothetical protein
VEQGEERKEGNDERKVDKRKGKRNVEKEMISGRKVDKRR